MCVWVCVCVRERGRIRRAGRQDREEGKFCRKDSRFIIDLL